MPHSVYRDSAPPLDTDDIKPAGPLYHCTSSGEWLVIKGMCECIAGYEPGGNQSQCTPCKKEMFKWVSQAVYLLR